MQRKWLRWLAWTINVATVLVMSMTQSSQLRVNDIMATSNMHLGGPHTRAAR